MKKISVLIVGIIAAALTIVSCSTGNSYINAQGKEYIVGDRGPAGGWIFYDKGKISDGWRYLEAAPEDLGSGATWCSGEYVKTGAAAKDIGAGKSNTKKIISVQGEGTYAAMLCVQYNGGGRDDWFLPSEDEAALFYKNLGSRGLGGFADDSYWCSTEDKYNGESRASIQYPLRLSMGTNNKRLQSRVRAVRSF